MKIDIRLHDYEEVMTESLWSLVDHFTPMEKWGDPLKMRVHLIYWLDALRKYVGSPLIIHSGYSVDGHIDGSQHYLGCAVDLHAKDMSYRELFKAVLLFPFTGIGIYPYWNNQGLHIDIRELEPASPKIVWYRDRDGVYHNLDYSTMCGLYIDPIIDYGKKIS